VSGRALATAAALALGASGAALADDAKPAPPLKVALDPLRNGGVPAALVQAVEDRLCAILGEVSRAEVVCPSDVAAAALLARNAVVFGECQSDECVRRVEAVKAADRRVSGAIERGEKGLVLSLQLAGPAGAAARVIERTPEDLDAVVAALPGVVRKLMPDRR
jgi:hypothetical protein